MHIPNNVVWGIDTSGTIGMLMSIMHPSKIIRSRRQTITLHITPTGELIVHAPRLVPKIFIDRFIKEKEQWITKKITEVKWRPKAEKKEFKEGESHLFLGKEYFLELTNGIHIVVKNEKLLFPKALLFRAGKELSAWYQKQAKELITQRVEHHALQMQTTYKNILFSDTKSKWGTCFPDNSLQFNWRLIMAPLLVIDYVVIHELTHTTEKNHGRSFWNRVRLFTPAFKQHREWLTVHGHLLMT